MSDIAGFSEQYGTQADVKILSTGFRLTHMSEFAGKTSPGVNFKQQLCQINRGDQLPDAAVQKNQRLRFFQFFQTADGQGRIFTLMTDAHGSIQLKA